MQFHSNECKLLSLHCEECSFILSYVHNCGCTQSGRQISLYFKQITVTTVCPEYNFTLSYTYTCGCSLFRIQLHSITNTCACRLSSIHFTLSFANYCVCSLFRIQLHSITYKYLCLHSSICKLLWLQSVQNTISLSYTNTHGHTLSRTHFHYHI